MKKNFLTKNQLSIPSGRNIFSENEYKKRLPNNIDSLVCDVKNKLVYSLKDWNWCFGIVYKKNWLVFKELLWNWNRHDYWKKRWWTLDYWLMKINHSGMLEFEILKYIKDSNIWVNTPEPLAYLNQDNINYNINNIEKNILLLKAFSKDMKLRAFFNLLWLNQILFQLINWLNSIAFATYKKHFKKNLLNLIDIKTITRPVIIMQEMKWKALHEIEKQIWEWPLWDKYNEQIEKLENIWIGHDSHYWNALYDEESHTLNIIDFWAVDFLDNMKEIIKKDRKKFIEDYPHIFMEVYPRLNTKKYRKELFWL